MSPRSLLACLASAILPLGTLALHAVGGLSIQSPGTHAGRHRGPEDTPPAGNTTAAHLATNISLPFNSTRAAAEAWASFQRCTCDKVAPSVRPRLAAPPRKEGGGPVILVTVCEHMAGMLEASLACNRALVDRVVVVTGPGDEETRQACIRSGVECQATSGLHDHGDPFNKGRALRAVQRGLHGDPRNANATILLIDSDVCLPSDMWRSIPNELEKGVIYSVTDRCMFATPADYSFGWPAVRARWSQFRTLGMFQMYACDADAPLYSEDFRSASVSDLEFAERFKTTVVLPLAVNHMGVSPNYTHWEGAARDATPWANVQPPPDGNCPCCDLEEDVQQH